MGGLPIPDIVHIDQPYWFGEGGDCDPEEFGLQRARELEEKILELGPERVAAFIGEPIQGAAGVFIPPMSYWPEIERICRKYDVLLVADEVICGFGRTGHWFASRVFRHPARHHDPGQGHHLGLHPAGRGDVQRPHRRRC